MGVIYDFKGYRYTAVQAYKKATQINPSYQKALVRRNVNTDLIMSRSLSSPVRIRSFWSGLYDRLCECSVSIFGKLHKDHKDEDEGMLQCYLTAHRRCFFKGRSFLSVSG